VPERVIVRGDGFEVAARRVIVAMNPGECRAIAFTPHLPARRALLQRAWRGTSIIKFHAVYRAPFWRAQGYSGYTYLDYGALPSVYDASPPDGSVGILMAWLMPTLDGAGLGEPDSLYDDPAQRRATLLRLFAEWYGPQALDPLVCQETNWLEEPYTLGCACPTTPGVLTSFGAALRPPVDRLHWGSTETATHWIGYLNGAIESGERTAREVLAAL
jgi:monoamine oxidase